MRTPENIHPEVAAVSTTPVCLVDQECEAEDLCREAYFLDEKKARLMRDKMGPGYLLFRLDRQSGVWIPEGSDTESKYARIRAGLLRRMVKEEEYEKVVEWIAKSTGNEVVRAFGILRQIDSEMFNDLMEALSSIDD